MLVTTIRGQAESHPDSDVQKRLLSAAKALADATAKLVEAAKVTTRITVNHLVFVRNLFSVILANLLAPEFKYLARIRPKWKLIDGESKNLPKVPKL